MTAVSKDPCPRCGSVMVQRVNRKDGTAFWGCSRFPECRGTRPFVGAAPQAARITPRLSTGGRPRGWGDDVELALARVTGRNFGVLAGCLLRLVLIAVVFVLFVNLVGPVSTLVGEYMADTFIRSMATPTP